MKKNIEIIVKQLQRILPKMMNDEEQIGDLNIRINRLKIEKRKYGRKKIWKRR